MFKADINYLEIQDKQKILGPPDLSDFRKPQQPLTMSSSSKIHLMDLNDDTLRSALKHEDFFSDIYVARMEGIRITSPEMSKKN